MKPLLRGAVPPTLFRYFPKEEYAKQFLAGRIRMGHLQRYATIPDTARVDEQEGRGNFSFPGLVRRFQFPIGEGELVEEPPIQSYLHVDSTHLTPSYICCFSEDLKAALATKWGPFVVQVRNPREFIERLASAAEARNDLFGPLDCGSVTYDSAPVIAAEPTHEDLITQACFTKPRSFAEEAEYRMLQWLNSTPEPDGSEPNLPDAIILDLGRPIEAAAQILI